MEWIVVILLIILGILLVLGEILVFPGITIAGIGGFLFLGSGIYYSFVRFGNNIGVTVLIVTTIVILSTIALALRSKSWNKAMLSTNITGKVEPLKDAILEPGMKGMSVSRLAPMGKVEINGKTFEAKSIDGFIDQKTEIEIVKVLTTNIIVKSLK